MPVEEDLGERDKMILGAANGHRAIDQIALETHNPEFHVAKLMYDLMLTGHVKLVGEREETAAEPVFEEAELVEEDSSSFDPLMSGDLHSIPGGMPPAPRVEEYALAPIAPPASLRSADTRADHVQPVPQTTARRQLGHRAPREDGNPARDTGGQGTGAAQPSPSRPARARGPRRPHRAAAPAGSAAAARAGPPPAGPSSASEALPKLPPGAVPVLSKPMEELMSFPFTPSEAFIVSRINGMWDVRSIARISPFPETRGDARVPQAREERRRFLQVTFLFDFRPVLFTAIAAGLLVSVIVVTRKLAQARSGAAELSRKNRELATLRELTSIVSSVAPGEEILARLFDALRQALPIRALAAVSYEEDPDGQALVAFGGDVTLERRSFLDWLAAQRDLESPFLPASPTPRVASGPDRDLVLNPRFPHQVFLPLQTPAVIAGILDRRIRRPVPRHARRRFRSSPSFPTTWRWPFRTATSDGRCRP